MEDTNRKQPSTSDAANQKKLPPNPFNGRNADEVWKELYANSKPVSREEVMRRYQEKKSNRK